MTDAYKIGRQCRIAGMASNKNEGFKHACIKIHNDINNDEYKDLQGLFFAGNVANKEEDAVDTEIGDDGSGFVCLRPGRVEPLDKRHVLTGKYTHLSLIQFYLPMTDLIHAKICMLNLITNKTVRTKSM